MKCDNLLHKRSFAKTQLLHTVTFKCLLQVDHTRVNEFGYSGEMLDEAAQKNAVEGNKEDENPPQKQIEAKKKD